MEVLSFFLTESNLVNYFGDFINNYPRLVLKSRDADTAFYSKSQKNKHEIYFHFIPYNIEYEVYTDEEKAYIKHFFSDRHISSFDIQYRDEVFLRQFLKDFKHFLSEKEIDIAQQMLIGHPHNGVLSFDNFTTHFPKTPNLLHRIFVYLAKP